MTRKPQPPRQRDIVTLADLTPQRQIVGGSQQRVFGAGVPHEPADRAVGSGRKAGIAKVGRKKAGHTD